MLPGALRLHRVDAGGEVAAGGESGIGLVFFSSRRRHTRFKCDWSSDVCSSDLSPLPRSVIELEIGKALNDAAGQRGPLAHDTNDIKRQQSLNHGVRIGEMVLKYGDEIGRASCRERV